MQAEIDPGHYAGIRVMVACHSKLVKSGRYACQALGGSEPLREDAIFRIASISSFDGVELTTYSRNLRNAACR